MLALATRVAWGPTAGPAATSVGLSAATLGELYARDASLNAVLVLLVAEPCAKLSDPLVVHVEPPVVVDPALETM